MPWNTAGWAVLSLIWICSSDGCASILNNNRFDVPFYSESNSNNFQIYWNVPTFMCHKYGMYFPQVFRKFGIIQNDKDKFRGDKIAILYDPGDFPAVMKDNKDNYFRRNGGVPQEGNLTLHLEHFRRHLSEQIPSGNFSGLGVIDFESWRPIFRQNWASLQIYRDLSLDIERQRHPFYPEKKIQQDATNRFEKFGQIFMQRTLELAQKLRPKADWGYYAYPYCFNWTPNQQSPQCVPKVIEENDRMSWLFKNAKVLYPSVYLQHKLTPSQRVGLVRGRVQEAVRLAKNSQNEISKVFVYYWYKYQDKRDVFIDKRDIIGTIKEVAKRGADGLVIWGSSSDLDSQDKCETFLDYLLQTLGPTIVQLQQQINSPETS